MKRVKIIGSILLAGFFLGGCATDRSANRGPEKVIVQVESSEKYDGLAERLRTLEESVNLLRAQQESIARLRSEVANLEKRFRNIHARPPLCTL